MDKLPFVVTVTKPQAKFACDKWQINVKSIEKLQIPLQKICKQLFLQNCVFSQKTAFDFQKKIDFQKILYLIQLIICTQLIVGILKKV